MHEQCRAQAWNSVPSTYGITTPPVVLHLII